MGDCKHMFSIHVLLLLIAAESVTIYPHSTLQLDDFASESFISQDEQRKIWHEESRVALQNICDSKNNSFLKCLGKMKHGSFGIGMMVEIFNDPSRGVQVYRNCRGKPENPTQPDFDQSCMVSPNNFPKLKAFLKILKKDAEDANRYAFLPSLSAFDKEVRRTREFARLVGADGISLGAAILDIRETATGQPHGLHTIAFIQELIAGLDVYEVLDELQKSEAIMMRDNLDHLLCRYDLYVKALGTSQVEGDRVFAKFKNSVVKFQNELWIRARLRLRLGLTVMSAARKLWDLGLVHCDLHWGNIMILKSHVTSVTEFQRLMKLGHIFVPTPSLLHSDLNTVPSSVTAHLSQHPEGIEVYFLSPNQIRFIDVSYAMQTHVLLGSISGVQTGHYGVWAEKQLQHPCRAYRSERHEDILELFKGGGGDGGGLASVFNASSSQSYQNIWSRVLSMVKPTVGRSCRGHLPHFLAQPNTNNGMGPMAMAAIQREMSGIDRLFNGILQSMLVVPEYLKCVAVRESWNAISGQERSSAVRSLKPHEWIVKMMPKQSSCSFYDIRQGGLRFQKIMEKGALEFPPFAYVNVTQF